MSFFNYNNLLIICDIQPQYENGLTFTIPELVDYIKKFNYILYLFNDKKINTDDSIETVKAMLKKGGATEDLFKKIRFYPKVFWYFRDLLDNKKIPFSDSVKLLKMLILRGVTKAIDLSETDLKNCISDETTISRLLNGSIHFYYDPKLAFILSRYRNAVEIGGFENQCNLEIEVYLNAQDIPYEKNYKFIY